MHQLHLELDQDEGIMADAGYKGLYNYHTNAMLTTNERNLTPEDAEVESHKKAIRVIVENTIAWIKQWKACKHTLR
jgi:hypothetical protein